jgi:hypothetical protein
MSADKIVSLRQIQRRSKAKFKKYRSQTRISQKSQTLAVNSLINYSNLLINKSSDFFNKTNELSDSTNNGIFIATSTSLDDFFFQNESVKKKDTNNLKDQIKEWALTNRIAANHLNDLLKILHLHFPFMPLNYRSLLSTPRKTFTKKINNGEMIYFGLQNSLITAMLQGFREELDFILLKVNIDGIPLFKKSRTEFWPILALCDNFINSSPFPIAIFSGNGKPNTLEDYLKNFIDEFKVLQKEGIFHKNKMYKLGIKFFTCDAPARAYLNCIAGHTSKHGCEKCTIIGKYANNRVNFSINEPHYHIKRKDDDFYSDICSDHIKPHKSPLLDIKINMVTQFPLDPMHLVYLGVTKRLLTFFIRRAKEK